MYNRVVVKDKKQDLKTPKPYWEQIKEDPSNILRRKTAHGRRVRLHDTDMVFSVNSYGILTNTLKVLVLIGQWLSNDS